MLIAGELDFMERELTQAGRGLNSNLLAHIHAVVTCPTHSCFVDKP